MEHILLPNIGRTLIPSTLYINYFPNFQSPGYSIMLSIANFLPKQKQECTTKPNCYHRICSKNLPLEIHTQLLSTSSPRGLPFPVIGRLWKADGNSVSKSLMSKTGPTQARPCWRKACSVEKLSLVPSPFIPQLQNSHGSKKKISFLAACYSH